ncbi:MAG: serine hydrolase domain-containing protein [Planctomycetota bacterium]
MIRLTTTLSCLLLLLAYCPSITALDEPPVDELAPNIATLLKDWDQKDSPGCSIAVIKDGSLIYSGGFGMANLDHSIPNGADTVFRIASVSKHITAACMLLLQDEGHITLDSDIRQWLPEIPEYQKQITIRHLLHHTSGLRDYTSMMPLMEIGEEDLFTPEQTIALIARQKNLNFTPGEKSSYCNSGYFLLSVICKRASGKTLRQFADEKIFSPLEMTSSHYHDNHLEVTPKRATGYAPTGNGKYRINETVLDHVGDGGVYTTVKDLAIWVNALAERRLGANLLERLQQRFTLNDGEIIDYCLGVVDSHWRGQRVLEHGGAWVGYRSKIVAFPDQGVVIICLANCSRFNPSRVCSQIAELVVDGIEPEQPPNRQRPNRRRGGNGDKPVEGWKAEAVTGKYYSAELDLTWQLVSEGTTASLMGLGDTKIPLAPVEGDILIADWWLKLHLKRNDDKEVIGFDIESGGMSQIHFERQ